MSESQVIRGDQGAQLAELHDRTCKRAAKVWQTPRRIAVFARAQGVLNGDRPLVEQS